MENGTIYFIVPELLYDPGALLSIHPKEMKSVHLRGMCAPVFTAALFTITSQKQPKCPSKEESIKKLWYIYVCVYIYVHTHIRIYPQWNCSALKNESDPATCNNMDDALISY